jgi:hypothetical protein
MSKLERAGSASFFGSRVICDPCLVLVVSRFHVLREKNREKKAPKAGQCCEEDNGAE